MVKMENVEEVLQVLERYTRLKQKEIPKELDEYLQYVAKSGDTVFKWTSLKYLFREKLVNVIKHFHDTTPRVDEIPQYPNVDPFNYESMKSSLLERLELFNAAPFTIQRLCELLIDPKKQYSRIDKFMRALEKNILVVSTIEPGRKRSESENGDSLDSVVNGDLSLDVNVDIDMENEAIFNIEAQNRNGNRAATAEQTTADGEEEDPLEQTENEKRLTETLNVLHKSDDDILPNPKKAKLDLSDEELRREIREEEKATEKVGAKLESEIVKKAYSVKEISSSTKRKSEEEESEKDLSKKMMTTDGETPKKKQLTGVKGKELSISEESGKNAKIETQRKQPEFVEKEAIKELEEISDEPDKGVADLKCNKEDSEEYAVEPDHKEIIVNPIRISADEEDKIIEKQELEIGEKETVFAMEKTTDGARKAAEPRKIEMKLPTTPTNKKTLVDEVKNENVPGDISQGVSTVTEAVTATETAVGVCGKTKTTSEVADKTGEPAAVAISDVASEPVLKIEKDKIEMDPEANIAKTTLSPFEEDFPVVQTQHKTNEVAKIDELPTLTLNDQPMEDELQRTNVAIVDEVIMADSSGGGTAMATDIIELPKDEPAGMEIDDTSQEAMDQ